MSSWIRRQLTLLPMNRSLRRTAYANATILVIEQGRTTFPALGRAKQMLDRVGAHTIGAVMDKVRTSAGAYSYEYGYYAASSNEGAGLEGQASTLEPKGSAYGSGQR
jgi:Mrp family chromosome partitioning ATPase